MQANAVCWSTCELIGGHSWKDGTETEQQLQSLDAITTSRATVFELLAGRTA